jgi:hypothetical protein
MAPFDRGITFAAVDLVRLFESPVVPKYYQEILNLFKSGAFYPVSPVNVLPIEKIEDAFRLIAGRKHTGKVVLSCSEDAVVKATLPKPQRLQLSGNGTYIIAGGLGDLGRKITVWLAVHGAGHVVTLSRGTPKEDIRRELENRVEQAGGTLHIVKCDILDELSVLNAANYCSNLPPVRGVVNGGMVLRVSTLRFKL